MYAGPDHPPWNGPGPGPGPAQPSPTHSASGRLALHLGLLMYPLTSGVLTGAVMLLLLMLHPQPGWDILLTATGAALLLAGLAARWLALRLLRLSRGASERMDRLRGN